MRDHAHRVGALRAHGAQAAPIRCLAIPAVGAAAVLALGLSGCTTSPGDAPIHWGSCAGIADPTSSGLPVSRLDRIDMGCATLPVPLDPDSADGEQIDVQLVRVHQSGARDGRTPLLLIAGGPGQSGVDLASWAPGMLPESLLDRFDLIGFDPRGVGRSHPITCPQAGTQPLTSPNFGSDAGYERTAQLVRGFADRCAAALGRDAALFNTAATAADIDRIRIALGVEQLTYIGWSYGAKLGAEYARQNPSRVRAAVLDAPTDPTTTWLQTVEQQAAALEASFDDFAAWCATSPSCPAIGDARALVADVLAKAEHSPIPSGRPGDAEPTTSVQVVDAVISAMYDTVRWPDLANGMLEADRGDSGTLRDLADAARGTDPHSGDAAFVINCNDSAEGPADDEIRAAGATFVRRFPLFGRSISWQLFGCAFWTAHRHTLQPPTAATQHPLLVVGTRNDPATPYNGAQSMAASLGNARLLTWEGGGHTAVGRSPCITGLVAAYLESLTIPGDRATTCPATS